MTEEKKDPVETILYVSKCINCPDILLCPYLHKFQCPKITIERDAGNE